MKNHWLEFYTGIVTVKATGKGIERFINTLTRSEIKIWHVKKHGNDSITFKMSLQDVKKIRHAARKNECKLEFQQRAGAPFLYKRMWKNSGFVIGLVLFLGLVTVLSNMVWGIEIKGANAATEYQIRKELEEMDIKIGKLQWNSSDLEAIQKKLTNNVEAITWIGVELKGTTYHFQVVEKNEPKKQEELDPRHLVAKKKATIVDMFVEEGQPIVEINDVVKKGQLLVSGTIGKEDNTKDLPAEGKVFGETWFKSEVQVPLKTTFQVFSGKEKQKHYVEIANFRIPVWGFGKHEFKQFEVEENKQAVKFLKWKLPIQMVNQTYRESEQATRTYTKKEAVEQGLEIARNDIKKKIGEDGTIKKEKVLRQIIKNGKVNLYIDFTTIENIAKAKPITIQGDSE